MRSDKNRIFGAKFKHMAARSPEEGSVFLSYSRPDRIRVAPIKAALEASGLTVWWDAMLEPGTAFARKTEEALESASAVVVIWSKTSIISHWVRDEATWGRDHSRLVPVSIDGSEPPLGFRQFQVVDLSGWKNKSDEPQITQIVNAIRGIETSEYPAPLVSPVVNRRKFAVVGGGGLLAVVAGGLVWKSGIGRGGGDTTNSIAVLPFKNLSGDAAQAYFSDGLSEEVRSTLSRNRQLRVLAQTSSNAFRGKSEDAKSMARELNVAFLLEGSVRRSGDVVRIAADLINGATGFSQWSDSFDRSLEDIFAVQTEIANTVAAALSAEVVDSGDGDPGIGGTKNVTAYEAYLRGRAMVGMSSDEASFRAALAQFDAAIRDDPKYAAAYAQRSRTLTIIANQFAQPAQYRTLYGSAIDAAKAAIALAPNLADGPSVLGYARFQGELDVRAARAPFERSRVLGNGDGNVMTRFAIYSALTGRFDDANSAMARALDLDPLNPLIHRTAGAVLYAARDYTKAIPALKRALTLNPKMWSAHAAIGDCLYKMNQFEVALTAYLAEPQDLVRLPGLAIVERRLGRRAEAEKAFATLVSKVGVGTLYQQAQVLSEWGERDGAIAKLLEAQNVGDSGLVYARTDPMLDSLRSDPKFKVLLSSMGFD
jgi:TolB-like protein/tetratricopeptide (TPR) repeat protein